jgi:uncharacterized protein (TIRG00374 family)
MSSTGEVQGETHKRRPLVVALRIAAVPALLLVAFLTLRGRLPDFGDVTAALDGADQGWLAVAATAEIVSMGMFARQQRRLLTAFGVRMPRHRALALAYSRSAIAISLPAGSAISAAYAFRQFRTDGASRRTAATVMVLSGLLSIGALALLYVTGMLAAAAVHLGNAWGDEPAVTRVSVGITLVLVGLTGLFAWQAHSAIHPVHPRRHRSLAALAPRWPRLTALLQPVADALSSSRAVGGRHWTLALAAALTNWLTDLLCLYAVTRAFDLPVDVLAIAAVYLTVQLVRQIPLTPGGIGMIELSLLAGLVSAGAGGAEAAAAVLVYRLLSCWLIIPVGLLGWLVLRHSRPGDNEAVEDPADVDREFVGRVGVAVQMTEQRLLEHAVEQGVGQSRRHREP